MRRKTAVVLGVSGAALALTASSAFTAGGVTAASGVGFLGGSATVTVSGTQIESMAYVDNTTDATLISSINFVFSDRNAVGKTPTISLTVSSGSAVTGWSCDAITNSTTAGKSKTTCREASSNGVSLPKSTADTVVLTVS